jgi:hypothetical protein
MTSPSAPPTHPPAVSPAGSSGSGPARAVRRGAAALVALAAALGLALTARPAPSLAQAPPGQYQNAANGSGVLDTKTGLTWQKVVPAGTYTWANAKAYCTGLALEGGGWRLPTATELSSLVDETVAQPGPTIDATLFPGTPNNYFWSSSPVGGNASYAWLVDFSNGFTSYNDVSNTYRVRCVR